MALSPAIYIFGVMIALLAGLAACVGLFKRSHGEQYSFVTHRRVTAQIYGHGIYRDDTVLIGAGYKGQDVVTLLAGCPLLLVSILLSSGGSFAGHLLLAGTFGYFLYVYASMALGASYNRVFLLYVAIFSLSLFAFVGAVVSVDREGLAARLSPTVPDSAIAIFLIVSGIITLVIWGAPLIAAVRKDALPDRLDTYTTPVTYALDLAIITPATLLSGILILQNEPLGYIIASPLLVLIIMLAPMITLATLFQRAAGVKFTKGEMIGPVAGFVVLGVVGIALMIGLIQSLS